MPRERYLYIRVSRLPRVASFSVTVTILATLLENGLLLNSMIDNSVVVCLLHWQPRKSNSWVISRSCSGFYYHLGANDSFSLFVSDGGKKEKN